MKHLIFCDCETTGLDENKDHILELALVAVELPTFREVAHYVSVVVPPMWPTVLRNMHERVCRMHAASGLLAEIAQTEGERPVHLVEGEAIAFVQQWAPQTLSWHTPLAGANPDFDRRFLRKRMPKLHARFHYRSFDVRAFTQLQDWVFGVEHRESPHRALADCRKAISDVREFIGIDDVVAGRPRKTWGEA